MHKIVYLQSNEKVAELFKEEFLKNDIEMLIVKTGEEALDIISKEKVLLLLLDINIPDMRFRKLVDRIRAISPQVIINVCVDVTDPLMITKLSNRHHVHKIYVAPWDVDTIIEEVKESIEVAIINEQVNIKEEQISSEMEELKSTLESLKDTLKKQQHSYAKMSTLTDCFIKALEEDENFAIDGNEKIAFITDTYKTLLRMQTTGTFDIDKFEEDIKRDLREIKGIASGFKVGEISSCLFGGQSKAHAQNIRFVIFLIARLYGQFYDEFKMDVTSHYITTRDTEFQICISDIKNMNTGNEEIFKEYSDYVDNVISELSSDNRKNITEKDAKYHISFSV